MIGIIPLLEAPSATNKAVGSRGWLASRDWIMHSELFSCVALVLYGNVVQVEMARGAKK